MINNTYLKYEFVIVIIDDVFDIYADHNIFLNFVKEQIKAGKKKIAFWFGAATTISSRLIAKLVQCYKILNRCGGTVAVIISNEKIRKTFLFTSFAKLIAVCSSEDDLRCL